MPNEEDQKRIDAIIFERAGYVRFGKKDRVEACDTELKRLGYVDPDAPKERATRQEKQSTADAPKKHTA